jgi:hypothetical protein
MIYKALTVLFILFQVFLNLSINETIKDMKKDIMNLKAQIRALDYLEVHRESK